MLYTEKALEHFYNPRNVGELAGADASAELGEPECGDAVRIWIKVAEGRLAQVSFKAFGCPAVIACSSMLTELATGLTLEAAAELTDQQVVAALGGMPDEKLHCSVFAAEVLHKAIGEYTSRLGGTVE